MEFITYNLKEPSVVCDPYFENWCRSVEWMQSFSVPTSSSPVPTSCWKHSPPSTDAGSSLSLSDHRFPHWPKAWRQRVYHQTSRHQQSPERPASLGVQTFTGAVPSTSFFALVSFKENVFSDTDVGPQDFELNTELKTRVIGFLEEVMHDPELLTQERKAAANIIRWVFWCHSFCVRFQDRRGAQRSAVTDLLFNVITNGFFTNGRVF